VLKKRKELGRRVFGIRKGPAFRSGRRPGEPRSRMKKESCNEGLGHPDWAGFYRSAEAGPIPRRQVPGATMPPLASHRGRIAKFSRFPWPPRVAAVRRCGTNLHRLRFFRHDPAVADQPDHLSILTACEIVPGCSFDGVRGKTHPKEARRSAKLESNCSVLAKEREIHSVAAAAFR
jgi:hypothetical protein